MRYRVIAVGQLKRGFCRDGVSHYLRRLSAYGKAEVQELKDGKAAEPERVREDEAARLVAAASGHLVLLDERGELYDTGGLAARVTALETSGVSLLSLLIGGAEGHGQRAREAAREAWSLSRLTLPHELARLVLFEQLYRIETLRAGHPYHRD